MAPKNILSPTPYRQTSLTRRRVGLDFSPFPKHPKKLTGTLSHDDISPPNNSRRLSGAHPEPRAGSRPRKARRPFPGGFLPGKDRAPAAAEVPAPESRGRARKRPWRPLCQLFARERRLLLLLLPRKWTWNWEEARAWRGGFQSAAGWRRGC